MDLVYAIIGSLIAAALIYFITLGIKRLTQGLKEAIEKPIQSVKDMIEKSTESIKDAIEKSGQSIKDIIVEGRKVNSGMAFDEKIAMMQNYLTDIRSKVKESNLDMKHLLGRIEADLSSASWLVDQVKAEQLERMRTLIGELVDILKGDKDFECQYRAEIKNIEVITDRFKRRG